MLGPPGFAIRMPTNVPCAPLPRWAQLPLAVSAVVLSAVSCQVLVLQGARSRDPLTALEPALPDTEPSMQSTSPRRLPSPVIAEGFPDRFPPQVPVTVPSVGSAPCQLPAHAPDRSGGGGGGGGDEPPPQAVSNPMSTV